MRITREEESKAAKEPTYYHGARVCVEGVLNRRSIFYSLAAGRSTTTDPALMQCDTTNITNRSIGVLVSSCGCEASRGHLRMQKESSFEWTVSTTGIEPAAA